MTNNQAIENLVFIRKRSSPGLKIVSLFSLVCWLDCLLKIKIGSKYVSCGKTLLFSMKAEGQIILKGLFAVFI